MSDILPCLLLPLVYQKIVLPMSAVAEIIVYEKPTSIIDVPPWLLGMLVWQGIYIPLVNLEKMEHFLSWNKKIEEKAVEDTSRYSIAILNRIDKKIALKGGELSQYPFFSILLKGGPKLHRVAKDGIKLMARSEADTRLLLEARVQNETVFIPNLSYLWEIVDGLPSRLQWFRQVML